MTPPCQLRSGRAGRAPRRMQAASSVGTMSAYPRLATKVVTRRSAFAVCSFGIGPVIPQKRAKKLLEGVTDCSVYECKEYEPNHAEPTQNQFPEVTFENVEITSCHNYVDLRIWPGPNLGCKKHDVVNMCFPEFVLQRWVCIWSSIISICILTDRGAPLVT